MWFMVLECFVFNTVSDIFSWTAASMELHGSLTPIDMIINPINPYQINLLGGFNLFDITIWLFNIAMENHHF